ncbi:kinesin-like protein KIN-14G [Andrographis paniculata]|uniref:kinesin-like protein KIN-14G n=1 Tax=Andrographis paniculata TaxID=175694 RepID=UPI0021E6FD4C|nr:kinesin-like protein KIN-14G [Andrographis paniculata]
MAAEGMSQFSVESMVEDVLQQHGKRFSVEASLQRYEAARWLRKMVGVVLGKDLPAEPSEEDFRLGLRSGIILCNALNKVQPGSVPKIVVEAPSDGAACANSENIRNFLVATEQMEIPTFQAFDLEKGGESERVVNCVLALKSYHEWKKCGGNGPWKFDGESVEQNQAVGKNSDKVMGFMSRSSSSGDILLPEDNSCSSPAIRPNDVGISPHLHKLVCDLLADKSREDIPLVVDRMLCKLMEEFERKLVTAQSKPNDFSRLPSFSKASPENDVPSSNNTRKIEIPSASDDKDVPVPSSSPPVETEITTPKQEENVSSSEKTAQPEANKTSLATPVSCVEKKLDSDDSKCHSLKCKELVERQQKSAEELKNMLHSTRDEIQNLKMKYEERFEDFGKHLNSLANAASRYKKVLEENRKLYNQVQDLKGNIRVYCRVRPFLPGQPSRSSSVDEIEDRTITMLTPSKHGKGKKPFTFNKVFGPASAQEEVFTDMQPLIRSVLDGYNVCIFAYGQTGSGKTFTMTGPKELTKETLGVNYRALNDLFLISEERKDTISYEISVQMIEIYNEQVRDLLATDGANKRLEIRNNTANGINVPNANLVPVSSPSDVINLMNLGHKNRAVGSTNMNDRSSRSHSCLTVHVQGRDLTSGTVLRGCMHLVDLAGSERADKTDAVGERLKEAQHINRSLSALGDVIAALAQKGSHVPYRNSKLTQLLQDSLGGQAKTLMFVHISPEPDALGETLSTLKFAERVSSVELGVAKTNKDGADVKELKEQISALKAALARKEGDETGSLHHSVASSPDTWVARSYACSSTASWNDIGDSKTEEASNSTSRRHSLDSQDQFPNSPSWQAAPSSPESTKDAKAKQQMSNNDSPNGRNSLENGSADFDEMEAAMSDSSEPEHQLQIRMSRSTSNPSAGESRIRKPVSKPAMKGQERVAIPQPSKKAAASSALSPVSNKNVRQPQPAASAAAAAGRRKPVTKASR